MKHYLFFGIITILIVLLVALLIPLWISPTIDKKPLISTSIEKPIEIEGSILLDSSPLTNSEKPMHTSTPLGVGAPLQYIMQDVIEGSPLISISIVGVPGVFVDWDYIPNREFFDLMKSLEKKYSTLEGIVEAITDQDPIKGLNVNTNPPISLPPAVLEPSNPVFQSPN